MFFELTRVFKLVKKECKKRGMWVISFVENVVCDEEDQAAIRNETEMRQYLACSGEISHVRRPRFFWFDTELLPIADVWLEPGCNYLVVRAVGEKEPQESWVAPGWRWVSGSDPVPLPTFTRAIPRKKPPYAPAENLTHPKRSQKKVE